MTASLALISLAAVACSSSTPPTPAATLSVEAKMALVDHDPGSTATFAKYLDEIQAGPGACSPEADRGHAGDVIVASWQASGKTTTLLEWTRLSIVACGGQP